MAKVRELKNKGINQKSFEELSEIITRNKEFKSRIDDTANNLSKELLPYDFLCWMLAEFQLTFEKCPRNYSKQDLTRRTKKVIDYNLDYNDLCWLIASLKVYLEYANLCP